MEYRTDLDELEVAFGSHEVLSERMTSVQLLNCEVGSFEVGLRLWVTVLLGSHHLGLVGCCHKSETTDNKKGEERGSHSVCRFPPCRLTMVHTSKSQHQNSTVH